MKSPDREKINPTWASSKGRHPTWNSLEDSRHNWRKTFYIRGVMVGKRVKQKRKKWTRETIRTGYLLIKKSQWNDKKSRVMDPYWFGHDLFGLGVEYEESGDITGKTATVKKSLTVLKQPTARIGFKRGQRRAVK